MLKIRPEQEDQLAATLRATFVEDMRAYLRDTYPETCAALGDADLTRAIHHGMARSAGHGIALGPDVHRYLDLMFQLGPDFDQELDWARSILRRPDFTGKIRIDVLCAAHEGRIPENPEDGPFFP